MIRHVMLDLGKGLYVASYDPDWVPPPPLPKFPSGLVGFTHDPAQAMLFVDATAALKAYTAVSATVPLRPDGMPNRPLTARTILIALVDLAL